MVVSGSGTAMCGGKDWRFQYWIQKPVEELKLVGELAAAQDRAVGV